MHGHWNRCSSGPGVGVLFSSVEQGQSPVQFLLNRVSFALRAPGGRLSVALAVYATV